LIKHNPNFAPLGWPQPNGHLNHTQSQFCSHSPLGSILVDLVNLNPNFDPPDTTLSHFGQT
jgi:hypothetical protein